MDTRYIRLSVSRLIDGLGGPVLTDAALLTESDRIVEVGVEASVPRPEDCLELTFPDTTALPGLIDVHVHLTVSWEAERERTIEQYVGETDGDLIARAAGTAERLLRVGVTSAFSCGERRAPAFAVRDAIARGVILGPRLLVAGPPLTPSGGHCFWMGGEVDGSDAIRVAVRQLLEDGADVIKVMATGGYATPSTDPAEAAFPVDVLAAAADEAHRLGRRVTAHAHGVSGMRNAVRAGLDSIEHASMSGASGTWTFDQALANEMADRGIRAVPSIAADTRSQLGRGPGWTNLSVPEAFWVRTRMSNARRLREAGVALIVGTDGTDFQEAMHLELEAFNAIGFDPVTAIRAATLDAAGHLGIDRLTGSLEQGKVADVLIVEGAADRDIRALRRPRLVLAGGRPVQPTPPPASPGPLAW
jgi:imidazolonepropionase-like amidohydrolase